MNASARNELASIKRELNSIISELESISKGVRNDFTGIGNNKCADCIDRVLDQYYYVRRKLNNLDTTTVTESFAKTQGDS
jgi:hypothetical protein